MVIVFAEVPLILSAAAVRVIYCMQVCSCNNVDKGTIYRSVTEEGLTTVAQVKSFTKV